MKNDIELLKEKIEFNKKIMFGSKSKRIKELESEVRFLRNQVEELTKKIPVRDKHTGKYMKREGF